MTLPLERGQKHMKSKSQQQPTLPFWSMWNLINWMIDSWVTKRDRFQCLKLSYIVRVCSCFRAVTTGWTGSDERYKIRPMQSFCCNILQQGKLDGVKERSKINYLRGADSRAAGSKPPCLQELATYLCSEADEISSRLIYYLFKIHFNIILPLPLRLPSDI
jgi:hypothetical protein